MRTLLRPYADLLADGAWRMSGAGFLARLLRSTGGIGAIILVAGSGGDFATAGLAAGALVVGSAVAGPLWSGAADRLGQARVLPWALVTLTLASVVLLGAVEAGLPSWTWVAAAFLVGASAIDAGALVRARWLHRLRDPHRRHTALAFEAVIDEATFVAGPPLVTLVAGLASPTIGFAVGVALTLVGGVALLMMRASIPAAVPAGERRRLPLSDWLPGRVIGILPAHVGIGLLFGSVDLAAVGIGDELGLPWLAGVMLAIFAVGSTVSGVLWGALGRWSLRRRLLTAGIAFALVVPVFVVIGDAVAFAIVSVLAGLVMTPVVVTATSLIERVARPEAITTAMSWPTVAISAGVTIGAGVGGAAADAGSPYSALLLTIPGAILVLVTLVGNSIRTPAERTLAA